MDKVVYILGAGFSAPLGLPVMSNFIEMSRNLYASDKKRYEHFGRVFENIRQRLAYITMFYKSDLSNIEEVLSILEMERLAGKVAKEETEDYIKYIVDVIQHFTPPIVGPNYFEQSSKGKYRTSTSEGVPAGTLRSSMVSGDLSLRYAGFVLNLFNANLEINEMGEKKPGRFNEFEVSYSINKNSTNTYSVITLNYDLVLENYAEYFSQNTLGEGLKFNRPTKKNQEASPYLVKLHGSVDTNVIVSPTWNKTITSQIEKEWDAAYQLLSSANYIFVVGYSLPDSDAYVKYLLKSSVMKSENLKKIDVLCKDNDGSVKNRYNSFITLPSPKYRFNSGDIRDYLPFVSNQYPILNGHNAFFDRPSTHIG